MSDPVRELAPPIGEQDHPAGPSDARVTLVEYGDYECPSCADTFGTIEEVRRAFGPNLRFAFRHFPLRASHPRALPAAKAAEAAAEQGKFWPMHERLFRNQTRLGDAELIRHAEAIGLDLERFRRDLESRAVENRIREAQAGGAKSGVGGTPTLFINGERYTGRHDRASLIEALARAAMPPAR